MAIPPALAQHAEELRAATALAVEINEAEARIYVVLRAVPLPPGRFRVAVTDVLFLADHQYPLSALDMFWTDVAVVRPDGSIPQNADSIETYLGRQWRRFSWHRNGTWDPAANGLLDHFAVMEQRWAVEAP